MVEKVKKSKSLGFKQTHHKKQDMIRVTLTMPNFKESVDLTDVKEGMKKGKKWMNWIVRDTQRSLLLSYRHYLNHLIKVVYKKEKKPLVKKVKRQVKTKKSKK